MKNIPEWLINLPVAHRGLHDNNINIPENSIAAFKKAIENGYAIELDIHSMADGGLAVFHDETSAKDVQSKKTY